MSIANAVLLPLIFLLTYPKRFVCDMRILYAAGLLLIGFLVFAVLYETGQRMYDGNFAWQVIVCNYLLHLAVVCTFLQVVKERGKLGAREWFFILAFGLQILAGITYLGRAFATGGWR